MKTWGILLAAGRGTRLEAAGLSDAKQFIAYHHAPLYWASALTMSHIARLSGIIFVFSPDRADAEQAVIAEKNACNILGLPWHVAMGGAERQDSVNNALELLSEVGTDCEAVLIHDAARPFASPALYNRVLDALSPLASSPHDSDVASELTIEQPLLPCGVVPAIAISDTIKEVRHNLVVHTPPRQYLRAVQTPQGFILSALRSAHAQAKAQDWQVTDDAALLERCALPVCVVDGEVANAKITNPEDLAMLHSDDIARTKQTEQRLPCIGWGYDVHRYGSGRPMRLGGIPIDQPAGKVPEVIAHSDGDVLLHALCDALLGCIGAGDIGRHFPDTDPAYDNASSVILLDKVLGLTREAGLTITHVDMTVIAQVPRLSPFAEAIRDNVARLLGLAKQSVNFKATTEEGLGFTGEKRGIKAVASVIGLR